MYLTIKMVEYSLFDSEKKYPQCEECKNCPYHIKKWVNVQGCSEPIFGKKKCCRIEECMYYDKPQKKKIRYNFTCLSPRTNKIPLNAKNINKILAWAKNLIGGCNYYDEWFYWVEVGKKIKDPTLHIHIIWSAGKNFNSSNNATNLKKSWDKIDFGDSARKIGNLHNKDDYLTEAFTEEFLVDKLMYAINCTKEEHANFRDLIQNPFEGQNKAYLGCNSLTAKFRELQEENGIESE